MIKKRLDNYIARLNTWLALEDFLSANAGWLFLVCLLLFILTGALLFDTKLFLMGDDADYISDAAHFVHDNSYPAGRASLYSMMLGIPVAIWGINIVALKLFSFACAIAGFFVFYIAFRNRMAYRLLFFILLFIALCSGLQFYSSSNLSEAFFMMIQALYFLFVFRLLDRQSVAGSSPGPAAWCAVGFAGLLISLSKNIAIAAPFVLPVFYLCRKEYKNALLATSWFLAFKIPYEILLRCCYRKNTVINQAGNILAKDLYHHERGREGVSGLVIRFWNNGKIYLGGDAPGFLGFGKEDPAQGPALWWIIIAGLCSYGMYKAYRRNKYIFFAGIYLLVMTSCTFLALQADVAQSRIIVIFVPLTGGLLLYGLYQLLSDCAYKYRGIITAIACFTCIAVNTSRTADKIERNIPVLAENMRGNTFYGYTPDWINYLEMGRKVMHSVPDSVLVAVRKQNSLSAYTNGRSFFGIYSVPDSATADQLLQNLKINHVRYLMLASLRLYPNMAKEGEIIYTLHRYRDVIAKKYPDKIKVVSKTGITEPCYLVEVLW